MTAQPSDSLMHQTLTDLIDLAREAGFAIDTAWVYGLTWLAAGKLALMGKWRGVASLGDLLTEEVWQSAASAGLPEDAIEIVWRLQAALQREQGTRSKALAIVASVSDRQGTLGWDVVDAVWNQSHGARPGGPVGPSYSPELCDLLLELLQAPSQSTIWIPFDPTGQLVLRAVRRGLRVIADGPGPRNNLHVRLLLAIENPESFPSAVSFDLDSPQVEMKVDRVQANHRVFEVDYLLSRSPA